MSIWRTDLITVNEFTRPGIKRTSTKYNTWHYTANPGASAANHVVYFGQTLPAANRNTIKEFGREYARKNNMLRYASAHIFIDPRETVLLIPLDELAYHAGSANTQSVGIELCIELDGTFHPNTIKQAIEVGKYLNAKYGLTKSDQYRHYDINGKICPKPWVDDAASWEEFKDSLFSKGEDETLNLDHTWQWKMLGDALDGMYRKGLITDYTWATKAYAGKLTKSELAWLNTVTFARQNKIKVGGS